MTPRHSYPTNPTGPNERDLDVLDMAKAFSSEDPSTRAEAQKAIVATGVAHGEAAEQAMRMRVLSCHLEEGGKKGVEWREDRVKEILGTDNVAASFVGKAFAQSEANRSFKHQYVDNITLQIDPAAKLLNSALRAHCTPLLEAAEPVLRSSFDKINPVAVAVATDLKSTGKDFRNTLEFLKEITPPPAPPMSFLLRTLRNLAEPTSLEDTVTVPQSIIFLGRAPHIQHWREKMEVMAESGISMSAKDRTGRSCFQGNSKDKNTGEWLHLAMACKDQQTEKKDELKARL